MYSEMSWESPTSKQDTENILAANRPTVKPKHPSSFDLYRDWRPSYSGTQVHGELDKAGTLRVAGATPESTTLCTSGCYSDSYIMVGLPTPFASIARKQGGKC